MSVPELGVKIAVAEKKARLESVYQSLNVDDSSRLAATHNPHPTLECTGVSQAAEDMSPRTQLELEKNAPLLLSLIGQLFETLAKDKKTDADKIQLPRNGEKAAPSTDLHGKDENTQILLKMHAVLENVAEDASKEQQHVTVSALMALYKSSKTTIDLNSSVADKPSLLVTALFKRNLPALCCLIDLGARFPVEYELMLALAAPDAYKAFRALIEKRNNDTQNFLAFFQARYAELLNQYDEQSIQKAETEKNERAVLAQEIDKNNETVTENIFKKCLKLVVDKCGDIGLLLMCRLTPQQLMTMIKDLTMISIVETQASFMQLKASCVDNPASWLIYVYHNCKSRKEANKSIIQAKLAMLPAPIKNEVNRLLKLEQACFDLVFKKTKVHLERFHGEDMRIYAEFIPANVLQLIGDAKAIKPYMPDINRQYAWHIEHVLVPKLQQEISSLFSETYSAFPDLKDSASPITETLSPAILVSTLKAKWVTQDISSINYFYALRCTEYALIDYVTRIKLMHQTMKESLTKFMPSTEEMGKISEITQETMFQGTSKKHKNTAQSHEEILQQDKKRLKEIEQEKRARANAEAAHLRNLLEDKQREEAAEQARMKLILTEKSRILQAYRENLNSKDKKLFQQLLSSDERQHKNIEEDAVIQLSKKLKLKVRDTKAGVLIQVVKGGGASFHLSHGSDRRGTLDGNFIAEFCEAIENVGVTLQSLLEQDSMLDKSKQNTEQPGFAARRTR